MNQTFRGENSKLFMELSQALKHRKVIPCFLIRLSSVVIKLRRRELEKFGPTRETLVIKTIM